MLVEKTDAEMNTDPMVIDPGEMKPDKQLEELD